MKCIISCEHASARIPQRFTRLFEGRENVLATHASYDAGAANLARRLGEKIDAPVYFGSVSRLLVDLNRSPSNRKSLFSSYSRKLQQRDREWLLAEYYFPFRESVKKKIDSITGGKKPVLHISIHSFTPVKSGTLRKADIGLLYDPARRCEKKIGAYLVAYLQVQMQGLRVRRNYPYLGKTDGFTSFLRKLFPAELYAGLEIEMNQEFLQGNSKKKLKTINVLTDGISNILQLSDFAQLL